MQTWLWSTKTARRPASLPRGRSAPCLTLTPLTRTRTPSASWTGTLCWRLRAHSWTCHRSFFTSSVQSTPKVPTAPCPSRRCRPAWVRSPHALARCRTTRVVAGVHLRGRSLLIQRLSPLPLSHKIFDAGLIKDVVLAGEVISCLENASELQWTDLNELSVTLDLYVLTLPVEIEIMADFHHNR